MLLKAVLQVENYTVFTAENGEDALSVMDKEHIDLVVLDIMMPKMDGYALQYIVNRGAKMLAWRLPSGYARKQGILKLYRRSGV